MGGAAIIGLPLVYTMEMWQLATSFSTRHVFFLVLAALAVNVGYNLASGFRKGGGLRDSLFDALESYALGALLALGLLFLLNIVDTATPLLDIVAKTAVEAVPLSIGVSIANTQFTGASNGGQKESPSVVHEAGLALAGSIVFAFNVAPTEEIIVLALRATFWHLLAILVVSLALSYGLIFVAELGDLETRRSSDGLLQKPAGETLLAYAIALGVAAAMVSAFHGLTFVQSPLTAVAATVVLALPAAVGGAAGRLLV